MLLVDMLLIYGQLAVERGAVIILPLVIFPNYQCGKYIVQDLHQELFSYQMPRRQQH
jgi:hypothetical protein